MKGVAHFHSNHNFFIKISVNQSFAMGYFHYCCDCDVECSDKRTTNISIIFIAERQRHPLKCTHNSGAATISSTTTSNHFHSFDGNTNINSYILNDGDGGSNGIALYASLICCKLSIVHI